MKPLLIGILLVFLNRCGAPIDKEDVIGTFQLNSQNGHGEITLRNDDTYSFVAQTKNGQIFRSSGSWEFRERDTRPRLYIEDITQVNLCNNSDFPEKEDGASGPLSTNFTRSMFGKVAFGTCSDETVFVKVK